MSFPLHSRCYSCTVGELRSYLWRVRVKYEYGQSRSPTRLLISLLKFTPRVCRAWNQIHRGPVTSTDHIHFLFLSVGQSRVRNLTPVFPTTVGRDELDNRIDEQIRIEVSKVAQPSSAGRDQHGISKGGIPDCLRKRLMEIYVCNFLTKFTRVVYSPCPRWRQRRVRIPITVINQ